MSNITRRSFVSAIGLALLGSSASFDAWADSSDSSGAYGERIYSCDFFEVYRDNATYRLVGVDGSVTVYSFAPDYMSARVSYPEGGESIISVDEQGFGYIDGRLVGEVLYQRSPNDPVTYGCVLMSTRKMTVEQAAEPSGIVNDIIAELLPEGGWLDLAWTIATVAFEWQVAHHSDMWIIMKHWYCDSPKMITRKEFYLYSDKACTKLVKSWSVEAPVGVN